MRVRLAVIATAALATAVGAGAATPRDPSFRVSVSATYVEKAYQESVFSPDPTGCVWRHDLDARRQADAWTAKPAVRSLSQLSRWSNNFVALEGREERVGSKSSGGPGCSNASVADTSGCGERPARVSAGGVVVGYLGPKDDRFGVAYSRLSDPFGAQCLKHVFGEGWINFPQTLVWSQQPGKRSFWVTVPRARLLAAKKPIILRWSDSARIEWAWGTPRPPGLVKDVSYRQYEMSWEVRLVPLPRTTR